VFAGLPPPPEVQGLLCALRRVDTGGLLLRAVTDRRGQAVFSGLVS
jgi:hypothetical protein